ncbi:MAG TPA: hypothetical protein VIC51_03080 [Psychromonas sp.]
MSLFFNKSAPIFDVNGKDEDGWTKQDHSDLIQYGQRNPSEELIDKVNSEKDKGESTGRWY